MDDLEKESLTNLRVTNLNEETPEKLTCRQKATKYAIKGNVVHFSLCCAVDLFAAQILSVTQIGP